MQIFAYENISNEIRFNSSSGGIFTLLAERVLAKKGVVFGAAFDDNWNIKHIYTETISGLEQLRKSKYVYCNAAKCFKQVKTFLDNGRQVLFTGCPCQIAALHNYLKRGYDNLLCAEVVCHGAPQASAWEMYLDDLLLKLGKTRKDICFIDFRDKTNGWESYSFTMRFQDGSNFTEPAYSNYFMKLFLSDLIIKEGCFNCPFKQPNSKADITFGDLWGMKHLLPEKYNTGGTSMVIVNTYKGERWLEHVNFISKFTLGQVSRYNPAIVKRPVKPQAYDTFNAQLKNGKSILLLSRKYYSVPLYRRAYHKIKAIACRIINGR